MASASIWSHSGAYDALARAGPSFTLARCWAHVRRKFVEAEPRYPDPGAGILGLIGKLYAMERRFPEADLGADEDVRAPARELHATARREHARGEALGLRRTSSPSTTRWRRTTAP